MSDNSFSNVADRVLARLRTAAPYIAAAVAVGTVSYATYSAFSSSGPEAPPVVAVVPPPRANIPPPSATVQVPPSVSNVASLRPTVAAPAPAPAPAPVPVAVTAPGIPLHPSPPTAVARGRSNSVTGSHAALNLVPGAGTAPATMPPAVAVAQEAPTGAAVSTSTVTGQRSAAPPAAVESRVSTAAAATVAAARAPATAEEASTLVLPRRAVTATPARTNQLTSTPIATPTTTTSTSTTAAAMVPLTPFTAVFHAAHEAATPVWNRIEDVAGHLTQRQVALLLLACVTLVALHVMTLLVHSLSGDNTAGAISSAALVDAPRGLHSDASSLGWLGWGLLGALLSNALTSQRTGRLVSNNNTYEEAEGEEEEIDDLRIIRKRASHEASDSDLDFHHHPSNSHTGNGSRTGEGRVPRSSRRLQFAGGDRGGYEEDTEDIGEEPQPVSLAALHREAMAHTSTAPTAGSNGSASGVSSGRSRRGSGASSGHPPQRPPHHTHHDAAPAAQHHDAAAAAQHHDNAAVSGQQQQQQQSLGVGAVGVAGTGAPARRVSISLPSTAASPLVERVEEEGGVEAVSDSSTRGTGTATPILSGLEAAEDASDSTAAAALVLAEAASGAETDASAGKGVGEKAAALPQTASPGAVVDSYLRAIDAADRRGEPDEALRLCNVALQALTHATSTSSGSGSSGGSGGSGSDCPEWVLPPLLPGATEMTFPSEAARVNYERNYPPVPHTLTRVRAALLWRRARTALVRGSGMLKKGEGDALATFSEGLADALASLADWEEDADAHKLAGILYAKSARDTKAKIASAHKIRDHTRRALEIRPHDPILHHILGMWCYEVASLTWVQRKAASFLFATPPTSTFPEAIAHLQRSEELAVAPGGGGAMMSTRLKLAQAYLADGKKGEAANWVRRSLEVPPGVGEDLEDIKAQAALATSLGVIAPAATKVA